MTKLHHTLTPTPIGELVVVADEIGIQRIGLTAHSTAPEDSIRDDDALAEPRRQLCAYFAQELQEFSLQLHPLGTPFQLQVWGLLQEIPYGTTASYGELARKLNRPSASRAVGAANGANPIPFVIPCHRVIGSDGSLTGYALGIEMKRSLLALESAMPASSQSDLFVDTPATSPTRERGVETPDVTKHNSVIRAQSTAL